MFVKMKTTGMIGAKLEKATFGEEHDLMRVARDEDKTMEMDWGWGQELLIEVRQKMMESRISKDRQIWREDNEDEDWDWIDMDGTMDNRLEQMELLDWININRLWMRILTGIRNQEIWWRLEDSWEGYWLSEEDIGWGWMDVETTRKARWRWWTCREVKILHDVGGGPDDSNFDLTGRKIPQNHWLNEEDDTERMNDKDFVGILMTSVCFQWVHGRTWNSTWQQWRRNLYRV
jgi:hypothetical protein